MEFNNSQLPCFTVLHPLLVPKRKINFHFPSDAENPRIYIFPREDERCWRINGKTEQWKIYVFVSHFLVKQSLLFGALDSLVRLTGERIYGANESKFGSVFFHPFPERERKLKTTDEREKR